MGGLKTTLLRRFRRKKYRNLLRKMGLLGALLVLILTVIGYAYYMQHRRLDVDPSSYRPLLNLIAKAESNGRYNAYFSNSANTDIEFTNMSIADVQDWQARFVDSGSPSSAVGRYQILNTTLSSLVAQLDIDRSEKFSPSTQDRLAIALLERRGSVEYINGQLTKTEFSANLAKEWASLPKMTGNSPESSYYHADGLNKSRVSSKDVLRAVDQLKSK